MIEIFDILEDDYWRKRVVDSIPDIVNSGHPNANNYIDLEKRLDLYDCFNLVVDTDKDELLAISGLFNGGIYPKHIARVVDRTYYYNWSTHDNSAFNRSTRYNANYCIPYQVQKATELGYDYVFVSIQNPKKRRALASVITYYPIEFKMLGRLYNTCKLLKDDKVNTDSLCWQNVAICKLNDKNTEFNLASISRNSYHE